MSLLPPDAVRAEYAAWRWSVVWEWPEKSTTWRLDPPDRATSHFLKPTFLKPNFLKVARSGRFPTLLDENARTRWAGAFLPVPEVIAYGTDETFEWLLTVGLDGVDATQHPWHADPERLVPALARGLAAFHAAAPIESCPFDFTASRALDHVRRRVKNGIATAADLHPEYQRFTVEGALEELERLAPDHEDLVVGHGDYCLPNVLLDETGAITGYIDLGELGVADRWLDIAVGAWSVTWNLGPGWEPLFYEAYGVEPDERRITFSRLLYDLTS